MSQPTQYLYPNPSLTEDGAVVTYSSKDITRVKLLPDGVVEAIDPRSEEIIEKYNLNSFEEKEIRKNAALLRNLIAANEGFRDPIQFFVMSLNEIATLNRNADKHYGNTVNVLIRTLYANVITVLEAFFSNFLVLSVHADPDTLKNLGNNYEPFKAQSYKLKDLISEERTAKELVLDQLNSVTFHNLNTVSKLYQAAFNIKFPPFGSELTTAILYRHDVVHRNGRLLGEEGYIVFSKLEVFQLIVVVQKFVIELLGRLSDCHRPNI